MADILSTEKTTGSTQFKYAIRGEPVQEHSNGMINKLQEKDNAAHRWYRFVLSFPPHLLRDYLNDSGIRNNCFVLDPFCGTGTTIVECKKLGISNVGIEALPMAHFASQVKTDWNPQPNGLFDLSWLS